MLLQLLVTEASSELREGQGTSEGRGAACGRAFPPLPLPLWTWICAYRRPSPYPGLTRTHRDHSGSVAGGGGSAGRRAQAGNTSPSGIPPPPPTRCPSLARAALTPSALPPGPGAAPLGSPASHLPQNRVSSPISTPPSIFPHLPTSSSLTTRCRQM